MNAGISGGVSGGVTSGSLQGAAMGAAEALAFNMVGTAIGDDPGAPFYSMHTVAEILGHGIVGGLFSAGQRGGFVSGFLAAGFSAAADSAEMAGHDPDAIVFNTVEHALAGGLGAMLGGGKFANGAVTGSFGYLFNSMGHPGIGHNGGPPMDDDDPGVLLKLVSFLFKRSAVGVFLTAYFWQSPNPIEDTEVTAEGIFKIQQHLGRLDALDWQPNAAMLDRLRNGAQTAQDLNFYAHELHEAELMDKGMDAEEAHLATLKWQRIPYAPGYQADLYAREVIERFPDAFSADSRARAGLH